MTSIAFIDTEIDPKSGRINDIGGIYDAGNQFHSSSIPNFIDFVKGAQFLCGHNILNHDLKYLKPYFSNSELSGINAIDTLYLSPLLFPARPYHALLKDDKLQSDDLNNPLNDSIKARDLFYDEVAAFSKIDASLKQIFYLLLNEQIEFKSFFEFVSFKSELNLETEASIKEKFSNEICDRVNISNIIKENPVGLAYCLALINCRNRYSITPRWVSKNYPEVDRIMTVLRDNPCLEGCDYCRKALDVNRGLKKFFGFHVFRNYAGQPLQKNAVQAAIDHKSILAVFPTGGGKSITFQLPAIMCGEATKGLTVVISPLQSLMKDQVDNLENAGITDAVTINGLMDPIERGKSFERVQDGLASILYISPESLRSKTIEHLLLGRKIIRFVIDEAHCFSAWGQDFRVDYLYIADFIKSLQEKKQIEDPIPVSCFTATAKQKVIEDIRSYFKEKLSIDLELFRSNASRTNLHYNVFEQSNEEGKYQKVRDLIEEKNCPTIIYVSRTRKADLLADRLKHDGFHALSYHGKMNSNEKTRSQNTFISGEVPTMVATSAFGMGVDKKDVGMVIHFDISDSLENYIQEAGRAGRDDNITAECYVLFNEEDLGKHFILLNQTKLSVKEIGQVWKAIKQITRFRSTASNSALEIARKAGWDDSLDEMELRVKTAIAALEDAGYIKRGQNMPKVFANSILSKTAQEAVDKINASTSFSENQKVTATRIIKRLFSSRSKNLNEDEVAESRVDHISDHLGIVKEEVIKILNLLREEKILADTKDLTAFIKKGENKNRSRKIVETFSHLENFLLPVFEEQEKTFNLKELNDQAEKQGYKNITPARIKTIINFWAIKNWIKRHYQDHSRNHVIVVYSQPRETLKERLVKRHELAKFLIDYLHKKSTDSSDNSVEKEELLVEFSVHELKDALKDRVQLFDLNVSIDDIEDTLFYLSRIEAIKIEGGFLVIYNRLTIDRVEGNNKVQYKNEDYQKLNQFYDNKAQQIHIVGEYAKKMIEDYKSALQFVEDYFQLNYSSFLNKYFPGSRQDEIKNTLTPAKFQQLFGLLSPAQLEIIKDHQSKYIVVAAGPGSGKTRVLVHKLASLLLMEDVKHEQLLMLTFSRAAVTEFKKRLMGLIGNAAAYVEIKTFHSYCFDLLGKVGSLEKSGGILKSTIEKINRGEVEINKITKTVLVIDEAQDIDADEFALINALIQKNEEMRVIAVGDDDQNIYSFRGADSKYLEQFITEGKATKYELTENYRSKRNLVKFSNQFVEGINHRLKEIPISAKQHDNGTIKVNHYNCNNLITPLVNDLLTTDLSGTTCVLTNTNDEALQITGLLLRNGLPAKLIQSNDGFSVFNLAEVRYFLSVLKLQNDNITIDNDIWTDAKRKLLAEYGQSSKLNVCKSIIIDFEATNPKSKYISDFEMFIKESKLEDFFNKNGETIFVSTMHKAKGAEFDNVVLLLENFDATTDDKKRQLYVAMTRAKETLSIYLNGSYLNGIVVDGLVRIEDQKSYSPPGQLAIHLTHRDINLGYFEYIQHRIEKLRSGDILRLTEEGCTNSEGDLVVKFSKQFLSTRVNILKKGFHQEDARVNFIVHWKKPENDIEFKIVLPELSFVND